MSLDVNELKTVVSNELKEHLPNLVPGLTKQAYEEIIQDTVSRIPNKLELMEKYAEEARETLVKIAFNTPIPFTSEAAKAVFREGVAKGIGTGLGGALAAGLAGSAIMGLRSAISSAKNNALKPAYEQALKQAMASTDPAGEILRNNKAKCIKYGETIFSFAPHVSTDPNLLKGVLAHVVQGDSIDPQTIRSLMELEEKKKNLSQFKPGDIAFKG